MRKTHITFFIGVLLFLLSTTTNAQLGVYTFTGPGSCPTQNPAVNSQPFNATFSNYTNVNAGCDALDNVFQYQNWNHDPTIDLTQYNEFTITPNPGLTLTLTSLSFAQEVDQAGPTTWVLRSSIDNFAADIANGSATTSSQIAMVTFPPVNFTNTGAVTFRIYLINASGGGTRWINDDVTLNGIVSPAVVVVTPVTDPANPSSNSPQCTSSGVTMSFTGTAPIGETWYWQTSAADTSTANSSSTYTVNSSGTYYVRAQNNTTLDWSSGAGSVTIMVSPDVSAPVFLLGATSTHCQGAMNVLYTATATDATGITYSLDAASIAGGNSIDPVTGDVSYAAGWSGTSVITATATGCNGPISTIHTVTVNPSTGTPVFASGATSTRCQGIATVTYTSTATNATGITYSLDPASIAGGNSIDPVTGDVGYSAGWSGISIITATVAATGCNGPVMSTHTVTVTAAVSTPVFTSGTASTRCQAATTVTYTASSIIPTGITYSLDAASIAGGNTINAK